MDLNGFEPLTSSMPWKRAPNCATGPLCLTKSTTADIAFALVFCPYARLLNSYAGVAVRQLLLADTHFGSCRFSRKTAYTLNMLR